MTNGFYTVHVELGPRSYPVVIGSGARTRLRDVASHQPAVIADETVAGLHLSALLEDLPHGSLVLTFPAGEASKTLATATRLYEDLARARVERTATIVAFGGGVAGDLAGFVAATWLRGVPYVQVPTTLLAAVDASVGGKTGVNLPAGKNLVGAFHQPRAVIIDTDFLQTLPQRECVAGLAESVKHACVRDTPFFEWQAAHAESIVQRDPDALAELIARNCAIKAEIVARDEREADLRAILNYGHTIGHALEHVLEYELRHGECVALGIRVENEMARRRGLLPREHAEQIAEVLSRFGLPPKLPREVDPEQVLAACRTDKKVHSRAIHFVLLEGLGRPVRVTNVADSEIVAALEPIQGV
ncbi:MAG: 3-dehydroquinate synthase [Planctomycetota bacterium]